MAKRKALNKSSAYIESFVDFILDTKPYHSKLTQVIEEYHFSDDVKVHIDERFINRTKIDSTWMYNFYSSASPFQRTMPLQRVVNPSFQMTSFRVGIDENKDMALVPFVYSKKAFENIGINAAYIHRARGTIEPLTESVDFFTSHGAYQFQIKQTLNSAGDFVPLYTASNDEGIIGRASAATRAQALDTTNPHSPINVVRNVINQISEAYSDVPAVMIEVNTILAILNTPDLPQTYEELFANVEATPRGLDVPGLKLVLQNVSSPLYFSIYSDMGLRESGLADYRDVSNDNIRVYDIEVSHDMPAYEEWNLVVAEAATNTWRLTGSVSGFIGFVVAGQPFTANPKITFKTQAKALPVGAETLMIEPTRKLVIHKDAPLETWNLIKVNSIAHSRPAYRSSHYGLIKDSAGKYGTITIVDQTMPTTSIILDATEDGSQFTITNTEFPQHQGLITVDQPYNDGYIALTIETGAAPYSFGDRFVINITNVRARPSSFELGFGYDLDAYDNDHLVYSTDPDSPDYQRKIGFYYDSRFTDYDISLLNLEIAESAINNRKFRLRALPSERPIATIKRDGSGPNNQVDLYDATSGTAPDPELNGVPLYSMEDDANPDPDLLLYYSDEFAVEWSDNGFLTVNLAATIPVGGSFQSAQLGVKFDFPAGSKPFISASADDGSTRVIGGDVFTFSIDNPLPYVSNEPVLFISAQQPRLLMHSDSFYEVRGGKWEVQIKSPTSYHVIGYDTNGDLIGEADGNMLLPGAGPLEGHSFKGLGIHFTIVPKAGVFAGDVFKFDTYNDKPSYLVHGSVTGWTAPATIGKFYWNGKIGFTIQKPDVTLYIDDREVKVPATRGVEILRLREDTPSFSYRINQTLSGYMVSRSDIGVQKFCAATGTYEDKYITFTLTNAVELTYIIDINANDFPLFHGHDTIIFKSGEIPAPIVGDHVILEKTRSDKVAISITTTKASLIPLNAITIDQRMIDIDTKNTLFPLNLTSPDAVILNGWLPTYVSQMDSTTSIAEFSDSATRYDVRSAANGAKIGVVRQQTTNINSPIIFEWDNAFYNTYLPLNAEANIVTIGSGWNDLVRFNITESVKFLVDGGALLENYLFNDNMRVSIAQNFQLQINQVFKDQFATAIQDGNFPGFMPGFGNLGYDDEPVGYDEGRAPDLLSVLANVNMTEEQRQGYIRQWEFFLNSTTPPTTEQQWAHIRDKFALDPNPGLNITDDFGYPWLGFGLDIVSSEDVDSSAAKFQEAFVTVAKESGNPHDVNAYDHGLLDSESNEIVIMLSGSLPPVPFDMPEGVTYADLDTPLATSIPGRHFEIMFNATQAQLAALNPVFRIWLPEYDAPQFVPPSVVQKLAAGKYKFTIPRASEAKIIVG